ncbi:MAG: VTT domain-containing protein [Treponema sp.]|nr:VTT domain-containing protein [Treponema sp.]
MKKNDFIKPVVGIIIFFAVMTVVTIAAYPYIKQLADPAVREKFAAWISSRGAAGWFIVFVLQMLQIIAAFIPGGPVEVAAGVLYGGFGGLLTCLAGSIAASFIVFTLSKKIGMPVVEKLFSRTQRERFSFLNDSRKLESAVFILFLIPGMPKDMLTYIAGTTQMKTSRFLVISSVARIPALVLSTFIGSTVRHGEWKSATVIFAIVAVTGILGILYRDRLISFSRTIGKKIKHKNQ